MRLAMRELVLSRYGGYWDVNGDFKQRWLCRDGLFEWFAIPKRTRTIWLSVYDKPAPDRLMISAGRYGNLSTEDEIPLVVDRTLQKELRKAMGRRKAVYVGVQYR